MMFIRKKQNKKEESKVNRKKPLSKMQNRKQKAGKVLNRRQQSDLKVRKIMIRNNSIGLKAW